MKLKSCSALMVVLGVALASNTGDLHGQSAREKLVVNTEWLKDHLADRDLVLLHVGERAEYDREHIPGARFVSMDDLAAPMDHSKPHVPGTLILELPKPEAARAKLESFGVSDNSRIVVYYGNDWISPSTRIVFDLDWIGLGDRTSLLDGGMGEWKRNGGTVTAELPTIRAGKLTAKPVKNLVVDYAWVRANLDTPRYRIIDARSKAFYDGVSGDRPGHIRGAGSLPFNLVANDSLLIENAETLARLFKQAGYRPGDTVVGYCHIGQQATAMLFAARTLGYKVLLYDGSFTDWETHAEAPVEKASAPAGSR